MKLQDDIPSFPIDNFKDHHVLALILTLMQDATENCHHPELVGGLLRLEVNFAFHPEHVSELIVLLERNSLVAFDIFVLLEKKSHIDFFSSK